jgi:hypothetical protein
MKEVAENKPHTIPLWRTRENWENTARNYSENNFSPDKSNFGEVFG